MHMALAVSKIHEDWYLLLTPLCSCYMDVGVEITKISNTQSATTSSEVAIAR